MVKKINISNIIYGLILVFYYFYISYYASNPFDDAFIHMRISRNFAELGLPYFNINDPVMGSSSHTWILLLSTLFSIFGAKIKIVLLLQFVVFSTLFYFLRKLLSHKFSKLASTLLSVLLIHVTLNQSVLGLMESSLLCLFFTLYLTYRIKENVLVSSVFLSLCVFTRNEFSILWVINLIFMYKNKEFWKGSILVFFSFFIYLFYFYGTIIPSPYLAKKFLYDGYGVGIKSLSFLVNNHTPYYICNEVLKESTCFYDRFGNLTLLILVTFCVGLFSLFYLKLGKNKQIYREVLIFCLILFLLYLFSEVYLSFWYWPNILFPLGLILLLNLALSRSHIIGLIFIPKIILSLMPIYGFIVRDKTNYFLHYFNSRIQVYEKIANFINSEKGDFIKSPVLLTQELGVLGWKYRGEVKCAFGLVSSDTFKIIKANSDQFDSSFKAIFEIIEQVQPDYYIYFIGGPKDEELNLKMAKLNYDAVRKFKLTHDILDRSEIILYQKNK